MGVSTTSDPASHNQLMGWEWVRIPTGGFVHGSQNGADPDAESDEFPARTVHLDAYSISKTAVTNAQYAIFVRAAAYAAPQHWGADHCPPDLAQHPVVYVSWHDACAFCTWAAVRLPTEQEWEKAARGVDGRLWPWGKESPDDRRCNYGNHVGATTLVDKYASVGASPFGVLDASGNVWEWVEDVYGKYGDTSGDMRDSQRVLRGGSFHSSPEALRCANRSANDPVTAEDHIGFRVVRVHNSQPPLSVAETPTHAPSGENNSLAQHLYRLLIGPQMSLEDVEDLAFRMDIDWDNLSGDTKRSKARALIEHSVRNGRLSVLHDKLREARPDLILA